MTPLSRGIITSGKLGVSNFAKYFMANFNSPIAVSVPDDTTLDLTNDFSGCAFVYPNTRITQQLVMGKFDSVGNQTSWFLVVNTSGFVQLFHSVDGSALTVFTSTIDVPLSTLSLVHFRLTGGTLYLGANGASEQSTAKAACFSGTANVTVGAVVVSSLYSTDFDITQPMIFDSGSSLANFLTIYNGGMPCKYSLIDPSITVDAVMAFELSSNDETVTDLSGTGNNGAFVGGSFVDGHLATWKIGPEVSLVDYNTFGFNGTDKSISTGFALNGNSDFSMSIWFITSSDLTAGGSKNVISAYSFDSATRPIQLRVDTAGSGSLTMGVGTSGGFFYTATSSVLLAEDTLYNVIITSDASAKTQTIYLDDVSVNSVTWTGTFPSSPDVEIGARVVGTTPEQFYDDSITEPFFFNRILTSGERTELYNLGTPKLFSVYSASITNDSNLAYEMTSNDNSLTDLSTGGNNGTANNGVTSDGTLVEFEII